MCQHQVNIETVVVISEQDACDNQPPSDAIVELEAEATSPANVPYANQELCRVAYQFGKSLSHLQQPCRLANKFTLAILPLKNF